MENNLRVVGEMKVGVELGNKRVCGNRETSNARNETVIVQLILRGKTDRKARRDASSQLYLRTARYPVFPTLSHGRLISFVFLKHCMMQKYESSVLLCTIYHHHKPTEMKLLEIKDTRIRPT
jgi:hypothetical protein